MFFKRFQWTPHLSPTPSLAWYIYLNIYFFLWNLFFFVYGEMPYVYYVYQDHREEGITRNRCPSPFFFCFSPSDDEQPGCNPLFLYVHQTIIWVVSTFLLHFLSLPMWGTGQMWNWIVMTVSDFYFYFEILYWIMYILNNAIILPVCNICVEISM